MEKGKVRGIAALFAALLALVLAAFLCMGLPVREADAAESLPDGAPEGTVAGVIQKDGGAESFYDTLGAAFIAAEDGATINIYRDEISDSADSAYLEGTAWLYAKNKSLTVNGNGCTLTASENQIPLYFRNDYSTAETYKLALNDLKIIATGAAQSAVSVVGERVDLVLNKVTLDTTGVATSNVSPLFIDGRYDAASSAAEAMIGIEISGSTIIAKGNGYAIQAYNPVDLTVKDDSTLSGWCAIYMRKVYSERGNRGTEQSSIVIDGSTVSTKSVYNGDDNKFGAIVFEDGNITLGIVNSDIVAEATGTSPQSVIYYSGYYAGTHPSSIDIDITDTDITLTGASFVGTGALSDFPPADRDVEVAGGTFNFEGPEDYLADGFELSLGADGSYTVVDTKETVATITRGENTYWYESLDAAFAAAQDGDTIVVVATAAIPERIQIEKSVTLDLNGQTVTVAAGIGNRSALDVRAGTFTLIDSSENGTGVIDATGADSAPDEGTVPLAAMAEGATVIVRSGKIIVNTNSESCLFAGFGGVVYIYGGTFINECTEPFYWDKTSPALAVNVHDNAAYEDGTQGMIISGGTFVGRNPLLGDTNGKITGSYLAKNAVVALAADGSFTAYPSSDAVPAGAGTVYTTDAEGKTVATVYSEEALVAAVTGDSEFADNNYDVVRLGKSLTQSIEVPQGRTLTLDLNGFTLTNTAGQHTIINNGTLTVIGNGTVDNVSNGHGALVNYGTATLLGGTYTRSAEAGTDSGPNGNSWYVIDNNKGMLTICAGATVSSSSAWSSMIRNVGGADRNATLLIEGGAFNGGLNTVKNDDYGMLTIQGGEFTNTAQHVIMNWSTAVIEGGTFTPSDEASSAVWSGTWYLPEDAGFVQGKTVIKGGTFNGAISEGVGKGAPNQTSDGVDYDVSGGTFTQPVDEEYFADGFELSLGADGSYTVVETEKTVATITRGEYTYWFESLDAAFAVAQNGDTVVLLGNVNLTETLTIDKNVTIDLAGYTIGAEGTAANITADVTIESSEDGGAIVYTGDGADHGLVVTKNATLTIEDVVVNYADGGQAIRLGDYNGGIPTADGGNAVLTNATVTGGVAGVAMFGTAEGSANKTSLTATASTISGTVYYGIATNGIFYNNVISLTDTNVSAPETTGTAMYLPGSGETTITGGEIKGATGIEIRAGKLTVNEGTTVTATGAYTEPVPNPSGTTISGVAIAVSQHTTERPIDVTVNGGTFNATGADGKAFLEIDTVRNEGVTPSEGVAVSIVDGEFNAPVEARNITGFISGGKYAENPAKELFAEGLEGAYYGASGYYEVIESVSDDLGALLTAQTNAQADVRGYAASNGMSWTYVQELSANAESALQAQAAALLAAYTDITTATNEYGVAQARLAAIDAVDALISAFDALKEAAIGEIDAEAGEDVVVPTATYAAIYAAETEAELAALKAYALAEIGDIRTYRGQINGIIEDLTDAQSGLLAQIGKLETLVDDTTGTLAAMQTSLEQKIAAVQTAVDACATSSEIGQLKTDLQTAITEAVNGLKNTLVGENGTSGVIGGLQTALSNANTALDQLTGALLNSAKDGLADSITSAQNNINSILQGIASLATSEDVDAAIAAILEDLAAVQTAVDSIADSVSASTAVEEAKTDALDEIRTWLNGYLDDIIGGDTAQAGIAVQSVAYTEETTDGEIYGKLTQAFSEENANLVLRYYNEALAAIDAATTVSEVTTAVSTFRAQVASVEAAAQNTPGLTGVYVLLAIVLVLIIVACIIMLVKGRREVAEQAEPAAEPVQKAQPEEAPAAAEEAPAEEVREAQPEPQPEPAQEAPAQPEAEEDDDKEKIVIAANVRSFSEAYMDLDEEQRALFGKVKDYALAKEGAVEVRQSGGLCIKRDGKQIVKLTVRRNMPVALFLLENEMLKDFRRSAKSEAKLKVRATELVIRDEEDLETAYTMVDLSVDQIEKDIEAAKERRREARRQRRLQRQAEEAAAKAQADEAAAEQAPAEDAPASDEGGKE